MNPNANRLYLAYGSNLNLRQMRYRCPNAEKVGTAVIEGYRLMFKGSPYGSYLTIEKADGYSLPVGVFRVTECDESALDRYEGFPVFYYKKDFTVELNDGSLTEPVIAFAYIMHEDRKLFAPSRSYVDTVREGYRDFGFDERILDEAIRFSSL